MRRAHYDVIIIGTGAGGGTLARHLAPSGKRILLLERGDWLPREPQNWSTADVFVDNRYISPDTWYDAKGKAFQPQIHYFVGGATKLYGAALYRLRREDFGELQPPRRPLAGLADLLRRHGALLHPGRAAATRCTAPGARTRPSRRPARPTRTRRSRHEPRIQQLSDDLAAAGYHPFHAPCGVMLDEANMPYSTCVRCGDLRRLPVPAARQVRRRGARRPPGAGAPQRHAADQRRGRPAGDQPRRHRRHRGGGRPRRATRRPSPATSWSCRAAPPTRPSCCCASANDRHPDGLANGSDQVGRNYMFHNSQAVLALSTEPNPTVFQKTLGVNDFYFGGPDFDYPMGNIQMVGKSQAEMYRGEKPIETKLAPDLGAARHRRPRRRLLAVHRGPAAARQPGHPRARRQHPAELHGQQPDGRQAASTTSSSRCSATWACTRTT